MKVFIDTNIFLDLILKREKYLEALSIFKAVEEKKLNATILDITILNIDYIARKQSKDLRNFLTIINQLFTVVGASNSSIKEALEIKNKDLEDNLQYVSARYSKSEIIITNDKKFYTGDIEIITSQDFVDKYLNF